MGNPVPAANPKRRTRIMMFKAMRNYIKRWGWYGFTLYIKSKLKYKPLPVHLPGSDLKFFIRPRTSDLKTFRNIFLYDEYLFPFYGAPQTIVDAGANIGLTSIFFAVQFPDATIIAIEPELSNFDLLQKNSASYSNIIPLQKGLWNKQTRLKIANPEAPKWSFQVEETGERQNYIEATTIDQIFSDYGLERIDILKIDIEGAEKELFSDKTDWLENVGVLVIELHDRYKPGCSDAFYAAIAKYRFKEYRCGENIIVVNQNLMAFPKTTMSV